MDRTVPNLRRRVSFRQLEVFEAIARLGSFSRAAESLHLTQPTVSMQIKKLRESVGLPLFEQIGRRVQLTEAGEALWESCEELFEALDRFEMTVGNLKGMIQGRLSLGVVTTAKYFAPRLLGGFCERYPGIEASLDLANRDQLLERLRESRDDLYIISQPPGDLEVEAVPFLRNPLVPLARFDHPLVGRSKIPLEEFAQYPFLAREPGSGTRRVVQHLLAKHGLSLQPRLALGSNEAIKQTVAAGMGVSVLSEHTLTSGAEDVCQLQVEGFPIELQWNLVYPKGRQLSVAGQAFQDYLLAEGPKLAPGPMRREASA